MNFFSLIILTILFFTNLTYADQHKTKFRDIKGYKEQFLSMSYKKTNRIITVKKSDHKVFLKIKNKDYFFVRIDTETRELIGKEMVDYCEKHF